MSLPEPFLKGRFNLYETPDGGYHLSYLPDGETETRHMEIPGKAVKFAESMANAKLNPFKFLAGKP